MSDEISRLRELEQAATPGPWHAAYGDVHVERGGDLHDDFFYNERDADLMAASRNALPLLLDIAEAMERIANSSYTWEGLLAAEVLAAFDAANADNQEAE